MNISDVPDRLKYDLAVASRILDVSGSTSAWGHISVRLPGEDAFLLSSARPAGQVTPSDMLVVGLDGEKESGEGQMILEAAIHAAAYRRRADVQSVAHTHCELSVVLSIVDLEIQPCHLTAFRYYDGVPIHPEGRMLVNAGLADPAIAALGQRNAVMLKWHGAIVVGPTLQWACLGAVQLEYNARIQYQALQVGKPTLFPREDALLMYERFEKSGMPNNREWDYWMDQVRRANGGDLFRLYGP